MFGYLPNEARPSCQPATGMPCWFRYLALVSASRLFSMIPKTPSCSTSCWAAVTLRAGSPASSTTVRLILRFPSSPSELAMSILAFTPSSEATNDEALGPVNGRISPTLIVLLLTPSELGHELAALTRLRFENCPEPPPLAAPAAPPSRLSG